MNSSKIGVFSVLWEWKTKGSNLFLSRLKIIPLNNLPIVWLVKNSDIKLGDTYPNPIVDHKFARERALNKYAELRK